jgi:MFS superfamily sulfate permease-like transporter
MKTSHSRTLVAGITGGIAMNIAMVLTFRLIGFGIHADGFLLDPSIQSRKLIAVWTEMEPIPLVVTRPVPIILGIIFFGIVHAYFYRWISPAWPPGILRRALSFALLVFLLTFVFWEFFTPFNQFGEPLGLIAIELCFWAVIALVDGLIIAAIMERRASNQQIKAAR